MGLFNICKTVIGTALEITGKGASIVSNYANEAKELSYKYEMYSDEQLKSKLRSSTGKTRMAIAYVLRQRGYDI